MEKRRTKKQQEAFENLKEVALHGTIEEKTTLANALLIAKIKLKSLSFDMCLLVFELMEHDKK